MGELKEVIARADAIAEKYCRQWSRGRNDYVRWLATCPKTNAKYGKDSTACYARIMSLRLSSLRIECEPYELGKSPLSGRQYRHFFHLCQQVGLIPPEIQLSRQEHRNRMVIPPTDWDRHTIYITLCLYRHADVRPEEIARCLALYARLRKSGTTFLQCFHYMTATTKISNFGHYFINFGPYEGLPKTNLTPGVAIAYFCGLSSKQRHDFIAEQKAKQSAVEAKSWRSGYATSFFSKIAKEFRVPAIERVQDILDPKYAEFYQNPQKVRIKETEGNEPKKNKQDKPAKNKPAKGKPK